ncbi:crotonase/enoyl-CoA hydratase family protein [Marinobacter sp. M216]|uniref:Crotonase/enoyl-CoA hydratase family protein n=1 Tax=Marinobacter albus TaxID=3030833 RepID=A0ABT7HEB7_9GAMM|nr:MULTISPECIES: crotonase/enoyl-CoA hydratase family protein [unclassified Marinobacter]MBW7472133.1 crotonase/enoyl-CoA hydratase family protein [Marinobacter sp. F4218]MDK9558703.1 crotonase/enoyl-CoA hydratase family protein [Marinobacter sp. M216]
MTEQPVLTSLTEGILTITLNRPGQRNAVDRPTANALRRAFTECEENEAVKVAVLTGAGGNFCAGADLTALDDPDRRNEIDPHGTGHGPMGPTRMQLSKPVIAAVSGYAVAGGLELALMCDMRVADSSAVFGVFCRRWGVPLIDGGTVRLPRTVGHGHAMDMILTGRPVPADEALTMGLANRVVPEGTALDAALDLARTIAGFPQRCLLADRASAIRQWDLSTRDALATEGAAGYPVVFEEAIAGARKFKAGAGRHGQF